MELLQFCTKPSIYRWSIYNPYINALLATILVLLAFTWPPKSSLTHWGQATHKCDSKLKSIGPDNGLSQGRRQAIIWNNAGILLIRTLGTNFCEIWNEVHSFSFKKVHLKMSSGTCVHFVLASMGEHRCLTHVYSVSVLLCTNGYIAKWF